MIITMAETCSEILYSGIALQYYYYVCIHVYIANCTDNTVGCLLQRSVDNSLPITLP